MIIYHNLCNQPTGRQACGNSSFVLFVATIPINHSMTFHIHLLLYLHKKISMAAHFGMIGLGTMGSNLVLNVADHGFEACGYDRDPKQQKKLIDEAKGKKVTAAASLPEFIKALEAPRIIMLLVPAGKIVDAVITDL